MPDEASLGELYSNYFTHTPTTPPTITARVRDLFYLGYRVAKYVPEVLTGLRAKQAKRKSMFLGGPPGKLLDVGCGNGDFLAKMKKKGWTVDGIDFDPFAIAAAKSKYGLVLKHGDIFNTPFAMAPFDYATLHHVIEHVSDPKKFIQRVSQLLKPDGRIVIITPNSDSYGHSLFGKDWVGLDVPRHLHVFNPQTLARVVRRCGLLVQVFTTAANADIVLGGSYQIRHFRKTGIRGQINIARSLKCAALQLFEHVYFWQQQRGEELVAICNK